MLRRDQFSILIKPFTSICVEFVVSIKEDDTAVISDAAEVLAHAAEKRDKMETE